MKITILGGGGFLGTSVVDQLLAEGHELIVFERPEVGSHRIFDRSEKINWVSGDFSKADDIDAAIKDADVVVHLISTVLPKGVDAEPIYDVQSNVIPTLQLLENVLKSRVRKIIFVSSGGTIYGNSMYLPIDEKHPTNPCSSYAITKLTIEKYLLLYQYMHGLNIKILRLANPYGEYQRLDRAQGAIGVFLNRVMSGQSIDIWGDGSVTRDYLYVADFADALVKTIDYEGLETIFNISSGKGTTINELIGIIQNVTGYEVETRYFPKRDFDVDKNILSNELAQKELKWLPKTSLIDGVSRTFEYMKNKKDFHVKDKS